MTGEKLSEYQVVNAVKQGFSDLGLPIDHFTVAPILGDPPGYALLTEIDPGEKSRQLTERIDVRLSEGNCEYSNRLDTGRLRPLRLQVVPPGTWAAYRERRIARSGSPEQFKHPCLTNKVEFIDEVLGPPAPHIKTKHAANRAKV